MLRAANPLRLAWYMHPRRLKSFGHSSMFVQNLFHPVVMIFSGSSDQLEPDTAVFLLWIRDHSVRAYHIYVPGTRNATITAAWQSVRLAYDGYISLLVPVLHSLQHTGLLGRYRKKTFLPISCPVFSPPPEKTNNCVRFSSPKSNLIKNAFTTREWDRNLFPVQDHHGANRCFAILETPKRNPDHYMCQRASIYDNLATALSWLQTFLDIDHIFLRLHFPRRDI